MSTLRDRVAALRELAPDMGAYVNEVCSVLRSEAFFTLIGILADSNARRRIHTSLTGSTPFGAPTTRGCDLSSGRSTRTTSCGAILASGMRAGRR